MNNPKVFGMSLVIALAAAAPFLISSQSAAASLTILDEPVDLDLAEAVEAGNATMMTNETGNMTGTNSTS